MNIIAPPTLRFPTYGFNSRSHLPQCKRQRTCHDHGVKSVVLMQSDHRDNLFGLLSRRDALGFDERINATIAYSLDDRFI